MYQPPIAFAATPSGLAARQRAALQELRLGRDTLAGLAHRHGLPVAAILAEWRLGPLPGDPFRIGAAELPMRDLEPPFRLVGPT